MEPLLDSLWPDGSTSTLEEIRERLSKDPRFTLVDSYQFMDDSHVWFVLHLRNGKKAQLEFAPSTKDPSRFVYWSTSWYR